MGTSRPGSARQPPPAVGVSRATVAIATPLRSYHRQEKSSFIINTDLPKLTLACLLGSSLVLTQPSAAGRLMPCSTSGGSHWGWAGLPAGQSDGTSALTKHAFSRRPRTAGASRGSFPIINVYYCPCKYQNFKSSI